MSHAGRGSFQQRHIAALAAVCGDGILRAAGNTVYGICLGFVVQLVRESELCMIAETVPDVEMVVCPDHAVISLNDLLSLSGSRAGNGYVIIIDHPLSASVRVS